MCVPCCYCSSETGFRLENPEIYGHCVGLFLLLTPKLEYFSMCVAVFVIRNVHIEYEERVPICGYHESK